MQRAMIRGILFFSVCLSWAVLPAFAWERETPSAFHERRVRLVRESGGDGVVVLFGYREQDIGVATTPFHKEHERDTALPHLLPWTPPERGRGGRT